MIVDLQNGFLANGALAEVPVAREMMPNVNRISAAMRTAGGLNVFLRYTYDEAEQQPWVSWYRGICGARNVMRRESILDQPWRDEEAALLMVIAIHLHPLTARGERRQA